MTGRERILGAARRHFSAAGADGFTMRGVAALGGVTAAAIYHHFDDREELLSSVLAEGFDELADRLREARSGTSAAGRMRAAVDAYVDFAIAHPRHYEAMFLLRDVPGLRRFPEDLEPGGSESFDLLLERIRDCADAGLLRAERPMDTALLLWGALHGLVALYLVGRFGEGEEAFRRLARDRMEELLSALSPDSPAGGSS